MPSENSFRFENLDLRLAADRLDHGTPALAEMDRTSHCMGYDNDVREHDRGIEAKTANRLQRDLRVQFRRVAEGEEIGNLGAQFPVFGQVPAGLAKEPCWWRYCRRTLEHSNDGFVFGHGTQG